MNYEAFISYRRVDTQVAKQIYNALREERHAVFFDVDSLLAGDAHLPGLDGREYTIDRVGRDALGLGNQLGEAKDLVLGCLDELWETLCPVMKAHPETWQIFCRKTFSTVSGLLSSGGPWPCAIATW